VLGVCRRQSDAVVEAAALLDGATDMMTDISQSIDPEEAAQALVVPVGQVEDALYALQNLRQGVRYATCAAVLSVHV